MATSRAEGSAAAPERTGVRLFAASARNLFPRLIASLATGAVAWVYVGPWWTAVWFAGTWAFLMAGIGLMRAINARASGKTAGRLSFLLSLNSMASSTIGAAMSFAIWARGDDLARAFAIIVLFIAAAYVLLHYYAELKTFLFLMSPYALALGLIGVGVANEGRDEARVVVVLLAAGVSLLNFFYLSRALLDRSWSALRKARAQARSGEAAAGAANVAKSAFLATMSHEIRTPLNGVLGMAQAMAAEPLSRRQRDRLMIIDESGRALLSLLNDILDLSKIEAGKLELEEIEFDLADLARGAHLAFTALANKKGLSFCLDIERARGVYCGDPTRLRQILYNLISNALKFTQEGEIRVTAAWTKAALTIAVADTGPGVAAEAIDRLFGKFDQGDISTTRRFGGSGLGLAICHQLAALMGGEITVVSQIGRGSTFTLVAPLVRVGDERAGREPAATGAAPETPKLDIRVLAAEDNRVNQLVLKTLLEQIGLQPTLVDDGAAALASWEQGEWDAILMDIQMPNMDGPEATRQIRIREIATGRRRTPIIALTANAMAHQVGEYLAAGMDDHVAKPIEALRLFEALQRAIELGEAGREPRSAAVAG